MDIIQSNIIVEDIKLLKNSKWNIDYFRHFLKTEIGQ